MDGPRNGGKGEEKRRPCLLNKSGWMGHEGGGPEVEPEKQKKKKGKNGNRYQPTDHITWL